MSLPVTMFMDVFLNQKRIHSFGIIGVFLILLAQLVLSRGHVELTRRSSSRPEVSYSRLNEDGQY